MLKAIVPIVRCLFTGQLLAQTGLGRLDITVPGDQGGPIPHRIHLDDADGKPVRAEK